MGVYLGSVVITANDGGTTARFWQRALDYAPQPHNADFLAPTSSAAGHAGPTHLHLDESDAMHLDLWVTDDTTVEDEVDRLVGLGASRVEWSYGEGAEHVVLADPAGNLFCVCG